MNHRDIFISLFVGLVFCIYANAAWALPGDLSVKFLDVGQGDSVLIQTPGGRTVLVDAGPGPVILERLGEETGFWQKRIDLIILTHPHRDHLEGLLEVLQRYEVGTVLLSGIDYDSALYQAFMELVDNLEIPTLVASPAQDWLIDKGVYLDIIAPVHSLSGKNISNANDGSIVLKLIYGDSSLLLTGDAESAEEKEILLSDMDLRADVIKAGHHGSRTSSGGDFLRAVGAGQVVISSGLDNSYDHPHLDTLLKYDSMGIDWVDTKDEGTVIFSVN